MYAYKQNVQYSNPNYRENRYNSNVGRYIKPVKKRKLKQKKQNAFVVLFRIIVQLLLFSVYISFVFPTTYNTLVKNILSPVSIPMTTSYENSISASYLQKASSVNLYELANPVTNYVHNDLFNNTYLLTPLQKKTHNEITTMYNTSELLPLKNQLLALTKSYPAIKPSIYLWEYDKGQYVGINENVQYPAASIIKLPVLVRMFKSIEANQFTIYDEMKMTEQYRSSGSGNLQYSKANALYNMDYLAKTMIQDSDNTSTNMIMSKLGGMDDINIGLRDWGISQTYVRTWLPDLKGTNKTTAIDMAKILYNLDNPGFLNINSREYIIDYLSHVKNDRLIQAGLGKDAIFIHKTGDIGTMLGDAGIVFAPNGKKYILVILAQRPHNDVRGKDFIVKASEIIYKYFMAQ